MCTIQSNSALIALRWVQNCGINVTYSCTQRTPPARLIELTFFVHYRQPIQATNVFELILTVTVNLLAPFWHWEYRRLTSLISFSSTNWMHAQFQILCYLTKANYLSAIVSFHYAIILAPKTTTACYPQLNVQMELCDRTLVLWLLL